MEEQQVALVEDSKAQEIVGYGCTCGFRTEDITEFRPHVMLESAREGKGTHKSIGRVNMQTGEVVMPTWDKRTKEQKEASSPGGLKQKSKTGSTGAIAPLVKTTDTLANAQEVRFVPRVYSTDYSPIMRAAQEAAVEFWGWPSNMTFGDFLDTALHFLFKEHGIMLAGYTISDEAREALQAQKEQREQEVIEEVVHGS